jgi:flavin reductase (DIM6/NTAB) family NADH-FMN oxidoreductase RutF
VKKSIGPGTLALPTPVWVVGTYDAQGRPNAATIAWGGICCSKPPCVAISLRAATYTHGNIVARRAFTVNVPSEAQIKLADYFGTVSGRDVDKFATAGLTPVRGDLVDAPYVGEFALILECRVLHTIELGLHTQFVGEILDVKADEEVLSERDFPDIAKVRPVVYNTGIGKYHAVGEYLGLSRSVGRALLGESGGK